MDLFGLPNTKYGIVQDPDRRIPETLVCRKLAHNDCTAPDLSEGVNAFLDSVDHDGRSGKAGHLGRRAVARRVRTRPGRSSSVVASFACPHRTYLLLVSSGLLSHRSSHKGKPLYQEVVRD